MISGGNQGLFLYSPVDKATWSRLALLGYPCAWNLPGWVRKGHKRGIKTVFYRAKV
jgi:hypothetical protein